MISKTCLPGILLSYLPGKIFPPSREFCMSGLGVSNCKENWVGVVVGGCGQLKLGLGLGLGVAVHGLIGLGLWLGVPKPHFAHP